MKKYYKGCLVLNRNLNTKSYNIFLNYDNVLNASDKVFFDKFEELPGKEQQKIIDFILNNIDKDIVIPDNIKNIFNQIFDGNKISYYRFEKNIIYEIITDENDDYYAKEIITGAVFPIAKKTNIGFNYKIDNAQKLDGFISYYDKNNVLIGKITGEHTFIENNGDHYYYGEHPYDKSFYHLEKIRDSKGNYSKYSMTKITLLNLIVSNYLNFNNILRCEVFVDHNMVANQNEINEYLNKYKNVFGNKRYRREFINKLNSYANLNVFKSEIIPKKEEIKTLLIDDTTKLLERIELNLLKLRNHNEEEYNKLNKEYQDLLNNQDDTLKIPITKSYLESLEAKILFSLKFDKNNGGSIINYLNYQKEEYLKYFLNSETKTTLTIKDIDSLMELYLKMQNEFNIITKRNIVRNISFLYLFELYENRDSLDEDDLTNSYINECLMSIVLWMNTLLELNIIKIDYIVDVNNNYTLDDIVMIIKNMKLNIDQEKVKRLSL